jgi:hypothetical protein
VGEAFDHFANVGSPITKDIIANLAAATAIAKKKGFEVYCKNVKIMTLQAGGVSKIESIQYSQLKTTNPTSHQRGCPTSLNP